MSCCGKTLLHLLPRETECMQVNFKEYTQDQIYVGLNQVVKCQLFCCCSKILLVCFKSFFDNCTSERILNGNFESTYRSRDVLGCLSSLERVVHCNPINSRLWFVFSSFSLTEHFSVRFWPSFSYARPAEGAYIGIKIDSYLAEACNCKSPL